LKQRLKSESPNESAPGLEDIGIYGTGSSTSRAEGYVDQLFLTQATPSFFTTLGAQPLHGRLPADEDSANVVVISHWLWQSWFNSDLAAIGRSYTFAGVTREVIGIMNPGFRFPDERVAFWIPFSCAASGNLAISTPDTTRRTSLYSRSRPTAPI
jgi:hypothetical protein